MKVRRHRAAIRRPVGSAPIQWLTASGFTRPGDRVLDFGCGHGDDVALLKALGYAASGWDPHFAPGQPKVSSAAVNVGFVLNVIEDPVERAGVLREAWELSERLLIVSVRTKADEPDDPGRSYQDGYITRLGTFQKFFGPGELADLVKETLGVPPLSLAPGMVVVFRDSSDHHQCAARRFRRTRHPETIARLAVALYEEHSELFNLLIDFWSERGRFPEAREAPYLTKLTAAVGSTRRIRRILEKVLGDAWLADASNRAAEDLLLYLALEKFNGRPRFSELTPDMQADVKFHWRSYARACERADALLMSLGNPLVIDAACRDATVGKLTGSALYVHRCELPNLEGVLRAYEGCARVLLGEIDGANIVKFHRRHPAISYLSYPDFDTVAHPALMWSYFADLRNLRCTFEEFGRRTNPPVLHRKEELVGPDYPGREQFRSLTRREEQRGLYDMPSLIGTRDGWNSVLRRHGVHIRGHRIYRGQAEAGL
jgi:DNA phosphorothioation-associated putative methyltransferase